MISDVSPPRESFVRMLHSGSDRTGALDFQASPTNYVPCEADDVLDDSVALSRCPADEDALTNRAW